MQQGNNPKKPSVYSSSFNNSGSYAQWFKIFAWVGTAVSAICLCCAVYLYSNAVNSFLGGPMRGPASIASVGGLVMTVGFVLMALEKLDPQKQMIIIAVGVVIAWFAIFELSQLSVLGTRLVPTEQVLLMLVVTGACPIAAEICLKTRKAFE